MPRKTFARTLETFVRQQDSETLASVLLELAEDHVALHDRLVRLQLSNQPKVLAAGFRKTLTGWRSTKFLGYSQAGEFGRELEGWLGQIERDAPTFEILTTPNAQQQRALDLLQQIWL